MKSKTDFFEYDLYQASIKGNIFERIYHIQRVNEVYKIYLKRLLKVIKI